MALKTTQLEELPPLNLTSMIDVVFLLLIFFMVATNFSQSGQQIGVKITNNGNPQSMLPTPDKLEVTVTREGGVMVDNRAMSLAELANLVRMKHSQFPGLVVGINSAREAKGEAIFTTMATVKSAATVEVRMGLTR
jgi:biopolymer transport protein ExbD